MMKKALKGSLAAAAGLALGLGTSGIALAQDGEAAPTAVTGTYQLIEKGITLNGEIPGENMDVRAQLRGLKLNEGDVRLVYCIQINVGMNEDVDHVESTWEAVGVDNLPEVLGVLLAGYNGSNAAELIEAAGASGEDLGDFNEAQVAYAGTQAAIWSLTDDWTPDADPTEGGQGVDNAVTKIKDYLRATEPVDEPDMDPYFETDDSEAVVEGDTYGPFTVSTNLGSVTFAQPEGATIVDENGEAVTEFVDGQTFYVKFDEGQSGPVALTTDSVIWTTPVGRVFVPVNDEEDPGQNLILAESHEEELAAELEFEIAVEDVPATTPAAQPQLPQTGTNLTMVAGIGGAVLLAGVAALVLMRRRAATAGADWGSDDDK
ncbi:Cys-Gln thioester bond-forming surface protein [Glycomyces arizonensis]|uniref:Cys-Gln thioester bond-forming surface protein n=1 Tax=Glycomyces arizonensis TaxID=256035 RepID=UPI0004068737|nr:Cys-Gln thioester bond-forming surface protein [Glycomyces arizonensis]